LRKEAEALLPCQHQDVFGIMLLKKIFKAKWQHNNPEVRKTAIAQLRWHDSQDRQIIRAVIFADPESEVVDLALSRISSAADLITLTDSVPDSIKGNVESRLLALLDSAAENADEFINYSLDNGNLQTLTELATFLKDHQEQLTTLCALLARNSSDLLAKLTTDHPLNRIRQVAVEFIEEPAILTNIASTAKSRDKGVYQKVKAKLQAHRQIEQDRQKQRQQLEAVLKSLESHAETEVAKFYSERLDGLERQYKTAFGNGVPNSPALPCSATLVEQIEQVLKKCRHRAAELERQLEADNRQQQDIENLAIERQGAIRELENTINQLKSSSSIDPAEIAALDGLIKTQQNRWQEATKDQPVAVKQQKAYQVATEQLNQYYNARKNLLLHSEEINQLLSTAKESLEARNTPDRDLLEQLRQRLNNIGWPEGFNLPEILRHSAEIAGQMQTIQIQVTEDLGKQVKKTKAKIQKLAEEISAGELRQAQRLAKEINSGINQLPARTKQDLSKLLRSEQVRLEELKDWKGYATLPKQEKLCQRMEYLSQQHLEPHLKAQRVKSLQDEWRMLGGSPDQKLWQRFKKFSDIAFEPCKEFFDEEKKLKQANLQKRAAICVQLEEFIQQVDWNRPDWKAIDKINKKAREEWRLFYPVDHKEGKTVQQRFNGLLAELDQHLSEEKERNRLLKNEIVQQAKTLEESEDIKFATTEAKQLQKKWQAIGITDHKKDRQLWTAFRKSCDAIFKKVEVRYKEQRRQHEESVAQAEKLIKNILLLSENIDSHIDNNIKRLTREYHSINHLGTTQKSLDKKLSEALNQITRVRRHNRIREFKAYHTRLINHIFSRQQDNSGAQEFSGEHQAALASKSVGENDSTEVLLKLEILAGAQSPAEEQDRRMALQVARLTEGLSGAASEHQDKAESFNRLLTQWIRCSHSAKLQESHRLRLLSVINSVADKL